MKRTILLLTIIIFAAINSKAQGRIVDLRNFDRLNRKYGDYNKDLHGDLDKFVGSWKYQTATELLEVQIRKVEHQGVFPQVFSSNSDDQVYTDALIVKYRYTVNNVVLVDMITGPDSIKNYIYLFEIKANLTPVGVSNNIDNSYSIATGYYREPTLNNICDGRQPTYLELGYETANNTVNGVSTSGRLHWIRSDEEYGPTEFLVDELCDTSPYLGPNNIVLIKQP